MDEAAVMSGVLRVKRMPLAVSWGSMASARRFIHSSSVPRPFAYSLNSCVEGER